MGSIKLAWRAWRQARRTRPRKCQWCGALIIQPGDAVKDMAGWFCDQDCLNAYEREMQIW